MISLDAFFWIFVVLFGIVGAMRGWSKELLVTFAVILTLFVINVVESLPIVGPALTKTPEIDFYVRVIMLTILVFFGYQSPSFSRLAGNNRFAREKLQDSLLGFLLGAINAYLFIGTILFYLQKAFELMGTGKYPIPARCRNESACDSNTGKPHRLPRLRSTPFPAILRHGKERYAP